MATRAEIRNDMQNTREHISYTIEEIAHTLHRKTDITGQIKQNPLGAMAVAVAVGFSMAGFAAPMRRTLFRMIFKSASAAIVGYATKKGLDILKQKVKT